MITTVTTTTVAAMAISATSLALIVILTLIGLLIKKEVISNIDAPKARRLSRVLNVAIVPLACVFFASAIFSILDVLR